MNRIVLKLFDYLLKCRHKQSTWPRKDRRGYYVVCLVCGTRLTYNWREMRIEREDGRTATNVIRAQTLL